MAAEPDATTSVPAFFSALGRLRMLGGDRALDLANTVHWRDERHVDFIPDYAALARWSEPARLLSQTEVEQVLALADDRPDAAAETHREWVALRAAFKAMLIARVAGAGVGAGDEEARFASALNRTLAGIQFRHGSEGLAVLAKDEPLALPLLRSALALAAFAALPPKGRVRMCEGDPCGGFFLDDSRSKPRRWCSMDTCGNRAKVRRFRARGVAEHGGQR